MVDLFWKKQWCKENVPMSEVRPQAAMSTTSAAKLDDCKLCTVLLCWVLFPCLT